MLGGFMPGCACCNHLDNTSRKSQEYDFGIGTPRVCESMLEHSLIHSRLGIPPIQIGREPL